nr:zinc knuckle CX2CX4HX4C [Tanacetum cinerariifolium]
MNKSVPWIYLGYFWHTLKEDGYKYRLKFVLDRKKLTLTLDDFRQIFQLPQATGNNHKCFVASPNFSKMVSPFFLNDLGFTLELRSLSNFKTTDVCQSFGVDVPMTQSQLIESTQGMHKTTTAPRTPNPDMNETESSAQRKSTIIRLYIPPRRSTRHTPSTPISTEPILTTAEVEDLALQDTIQLSIAEQKSYEVFEAQNDVEKVKEHLQAEEIEKMVKGTKTVDEDELVTSILDSQNDLKTRRYGYLFGHLKTKFMPRKKFNVLAQHLQAVIKESLPSMVDNRVKESTKIQVSIYVAEGLLLERNKMQDKVDSSVIRYMSNHILHVHPTQISQASTQEQQYQLYLTIKDDLQLQRDDLPIWLALKIKFEGLTTANTHRRSFFIRQRNQDDPYDDALPKGENSAKRQKTSEHGTYVMGESSSGQANESESDLSTSVDEAKLRKVVAEMLRQRCTSGDEHQCHIDEMQNFLENYIVWESRKEILSLPFPQKPILVVSYQRDLKAPAQSLVNQDLLYLKKGNSGPENFVLSLHNLHQKYNNLGKKQQERHQEIHKFCDATLKRVLEGLKSYNNYMKHGYVTPSLSKEDVQYLQIFEEEIIERLKHHDQMRRWEIPLNQVEGSNDVNTASVNLGTSTADLIKVTGLTTASHTSTTEANVPSDPDYDVWLPLALVHEINDRMKNFLYGYFISKRLAFPVVEWFVRNNWEKYGLTKVMMVRGFFFFKFSSLEGTGYTKETIRIEYEWKPPRCSTCFLFGHSVGDCPKAPKRVVNKMDGGKSS